MSDCVSEVNYVVVNSRERHNWFTKPTVAITFVISAIIFVVGMVAHLTESRLNLAKSCIYDNNGTSRPGLVKCEGELLNLLLFYYRNFMQAVV